MSRFLLIISCAIAMAIATSVWAQDDAADDAVQEPVPEAAPEAAPEVDEEAVEDEFDDFELGQNEDYTEEDDDIFRPTDVISVQQSVPFPVDI